MTEQTNRLDTERLDYIDFLDEYDLMTEDK